MSRPAKFWKHNGSPFIRRKGRPDGKKVEIDYERVEPSLNHQGNDRDNIRQLVQLRLELIAAERDGRYSAATKIRREINRLQEQQLFIQGSSCGTCLRVLHRCRCDDRQVSRSTVYRRKKREQEAVDWLHDLLAGLEKREAAS